MKKLFFLSVLLFSHTCVAGYWDVVKNYWPHVLYLNEFLSDDNRRVSFCKDANVCSYINESAQKVLGHPVQVFINESSNTEMGSADELMVWKNGIMFSSPYFCQKIAYILQNKNKIENVDQELALFDKEICRALFLVKHKVYQRCRYFDKGLIFAKMMLFMQSKNFYNFRFSNFVTFIGLNIAQGLVNASVKEVLHHYAGSFAEKQLKSA